MNRKTLALGALMVGGVLAACSSSKIPVGQDSTNLGSGEIDAGNGLCGKAACASGELCCESSDVSCAPTCMAVAQCPKYGRPCAVPDAGPPPGNADAGLCGAAACASGELCCESSDESCAPTCMAVPQCPIYGRPCRVPDAGPAPTDAGACCPATYDLHACTFPDGGAGFACHNPQLGCASSTTCGEGCDPVVSGRCGG